MRTAGSLYSRAAVGDRAAWKALGGALFRISSWQHPCVVGNASISASSHHWGISLQGCKSQGMLQKLLQWELCCCSKNKRSRSDSVLGTNIFLMMYVFISQSCWTVHRCTHYILSWNAIFFSFTPQCKPCWKNETPLCLEVRLKHLFGCLQLLSPFETWRLNTYWWAEKWVGHKTPIRLQWKMECRRVVHTALKVSHSAKVVNLKKIVGVEEHPGLCFPAQITGAESNLALWICVQPSKWVLLIQHSEIQCGQPQVATVWFCQSQTVPSLCALLMWASWHDVLNFLVF